MSFIIREIDDAGGVVVAFDVDNVDQHISGLPVHSKSSLLAELGAYERAYCAGLALTAPPAVRDDVKALVGKPI